MGHLIRLLMICVVSGTLLTVAGPVRAVEPDEILPDPALEARAREISRQLRCLVCRNESIDESNADLARDLRVLVRERLTAGDTDEEVMTHVRARYGDYVLLKPPLGTSTMVLWLAPVIILLFGGLLGFVVLRRHGKALAHEGDDGAEA